MSSNILSAIFAILLFSPCEGRNVPSKISNLFEAGSYFNLYGDWLKDLSGSLTLGEVTLPGTHDTMALYGGALSECQRLKLMDQLNFGIRVLDIRCRHIENVCAIHHGPIFQNAFLGDVLDDSVKFLETNPSEMILMRLKEEHNPQANTRSLTETIDWYLDLPQYKNFIWRGPNANRIPTLGETRGKIVVIDQIANGYFGPWWFRCGSCGGPCSTDCLQDHWTVPTLLPGDINTKWSHVHNHFAKSNSGSSSHLYINFLSGSSALAYPNAVSDRINIRFVEHLRQETLSYKNLGSIMMDFPLAEQVGQIIDINFQNVSVSAKFFEHHYEGGESKIFSVRPDSCITFGHWDNLASSIHLLSGNCMQLWDHSDCTGATRVFNKEDDCAYALETCGWNDRATSISQC